MTDLTDAEIAEMRRLAERATPGAWQVSGVRQRFPIAGQAHAVGPDGDAVALVFYDPQCHAQHWADAAYIAAANPARVLALVEALVAAREAIRELLGQAEGCWANHYGDNPEGGPVPHHIALGRAALPQARAAEEDA